MKKLIAIGFMWLMLGGCASTPLGIAYDIVFYADILINELDSDYIGKAPLDTNPEQEEE